MRDIETKISPLVAGMFPSFYQDEGPNFIAFVQAYYEWLEQNFQLLDLEDTTNFNVGDTIRQDTVTGIIISVTSTNVLVLVDGLETFKCFNVCSELIPVTSSSGGSTYITKGGTTRRLGTIFMARNLFNIRDIDKTLDLFVVHFKEKYLKNIEFDTQTNKRLLVKNSLDLYRSKGTDRSIDLFFRLIYGVKTQVYYPGDDLFRLSDAEWFKPQYIEINPSSTQRALQLVGKQITGVNSGATAFVERYVKKKINNGFIHLFYVSSVRGTFLVNEIVKHNQIYNDSPRILGSLTQTNIINGSESFEIGDIVNFNSLTGQGGIGRVTSTTKGDGKVNFKLLESGFGYTTNRASDSVSPDVYSYRAKTYLTDKTLLLANVSSGQYISNVGIIVGGIGYSNSDTIYFSSRYNTGTARPVTNTSGGITSVVVTKHGSGYFPDAETPAATFINSTSFPSTGTGAVLAPIYRYPTRYFDYLEELDQPFEYILFTNPIGEELMVPGSKVNIGGIAGKNGVITEVDTGNNTMLISMSNNSIIVPGEVVYLASNTQTKVDVVTAAQQLTAGKIIYTGNTAVIELGIPTGTFAVGDYIYQVDVDNTEVASAYVTRTTELTLAGGYISTSNTVGVFRPGQPIYVQNKDAQAAFKNISLSVGIIGTANTFNDNYVPFVYSANAGTIGYVIGTTSGSNASYRITTLKNSEDVKLNTDVLSNAAMLDTRLNANAFNLPTSPSANLSSIIFSALDFSGFTIGSIGAIGELNPGTGYNKDPIASVYQPFVAGYQYRDYIFKIENVSGSFALGEMITQTKTINNAKIYVSNNQVYRYGEKVYATTGTGFTANGVINYISPEQGFIIVDSIEGSFPSSNAYTIKSFISTANSYINNTVVYPYELLVKGEIKSFTEDTLYVKRIQFENEFVIGDTIKGLLSGSSADIVSVDMDPNSDPIGLNASVNAKASTANGVISSLQIIDSGLGFINNQELEYQSATDERTGVVQGINTGVGVGSGYYRTSKGFVSDLSNIHDGDYYQEYSYDIISRIPLDKYSAMFKKVMHTAGTRFFGSVLVDTVSNSAIKLATSAVDITDDSPYTVQDRQTIDVVDRGEVFIEIRD